jgi:DNA helicase-2/ATP-dependent DNA helicase PcrA
MPLDLDTLNESQREAVQHIDGPLLILAGPGSGKTRVVTHRIVNLLRHGIPDWQVLALTFTNKAANEMRERVAVLAPDASVWVSTFHRFGARLLRRFASYVGLGPNFSIYDASDSQQVLRQVIEAEVGSTIYTTDQIASAIRSAKNELLTPEEYEARATSPLASVVARVYPAYQQRLLAVSAVDFDDLLMQVAVLLYQNPAIRADLDARYRYILVDEYQDTNRAQYVILRALATDYPNLAATGDPDQSIYGWRGANLGNILEFEQDYPNVRVVRLEQNYRSTQRILAAADQLISHNIHRKQKSLYTDNATGRPVRLVAYPSETVEADDVAHRIAGEIHAGRRQPKDIAIFYRVNALSRTVEGALRTAGVPYQVVRGQEFFQRKEIKDVLAYAQVLNNPRDDVAVLRTINTPARGIGKRTIELLQEHAYANGIPLLEAARQAGSVVGVHSRACVAVAKYVTLIDRLSETTLGPVEDVVRAILAQSGYGEHLAESDTEEDINRLANIEELLTDAHQFDVQHPEQGQLEAYLERSWLVNEIDDWEAESNRVSLMTLHAAKGLEFPVVYMIAVEEKILPHERSHKDPWQLEEERRLAFVGITRAMEELQVSYAVRRSFRGRSGTTIPSQFLGELRTDDVELFVAAPRSFELGRYGAEEAYHTCDEETRHEPQVMPPVPKMSSLQLPSVTTAAALAGEADRKSATAGPHDFEEGMTVSHPEYGLGKIMSLSGSGKGQRAKVGFAVSGEKTFYVAHSQLRPIRK